MENEYINLLKNLETSQIAELFNVVCSDCQALLRSRLLSLSNTNFVKEPNTMDLSRSVSPESSNTHNSPVISNQKQHSNNKKTPESRESFTSIEQEPNSSFVSSTSPVTATPQLRDLFSNLDLSPSNQNRVPSSTSVNGSSNANGSSLDEEWRKFSQVKKKKDFVHYESVDGKKLNVVQGLELHTGVFGSEEQKKIVESVYDFQRLGRKGQLMARTYSEPKKWMRGKGRITMQFGCCYNYAVDKDGNPPGIIRDEEVDPLPPIFKQMISRMVRWHVLPPSCVPNSCIVNIYDEGDCIPPHIDHHDFLRPFCTVSFLSECNILFGSNLKVSSPGEFIGPVSIPLPVGSVLVLKGNGADVAKHCVPAVPAKRISVTFRRMDDSKIPYQFSPDPDLLNIKPLIRSSLQKTSPNQQHEGKINGEEKKSDTAKTVSNSFVLQTNDFPPLGAMKSGKRR
ncbi:RNA demethylase ALKBH5 [Bienertia sinuspersici]